MNVNEIKESNYNVGIEYMLNSLDTTVITKEQKLFMHICEDWYWYRNVQYFDKHEC